MESKTGVKESESPPEETPESLSEKGTSSSKSGERTLEQVMAENERKAAEIGKLREELQELKETKEERLEELQDKGKLTRAEKEEIVSLEEQIHSIETDQRSKAWRELGRRDSRSIAKEEADTRDLEYAMDWLEEMADSEKVEFGKFKKEIFAIVKDRWAGQRATKKAKLAFKEWKRQQEWDKKVSDEKKKDAQFAESGGKVARATTKKEILDESFKSRNFGDLLKGIATVQDEATKR